MIEMFDIVDENDNVIDSKPRPEVHEKGLWHRAVYVFVYNSKGELFLQLRSDTKDMEPGVWTCSASGHASSGQTYEEAAIAETKEEIGVDVDPEYLFFMKYEPYRQHLKIYKAKHEGPFKLDPEEVSDGRFITMKKLKEEIEKDPDNFSPEFIEILKRIWD